MKYAKTLWQIMFLRCQSQLCLYLAKKRQAHLSHCQCSYAHLQLILS